MMTGRLRAATERLLVVTTHLLVAVLVVSACTGRDHWQGVRGTVALSLMGVSGNHQRGVAGQILTDSLVVEVMDERGRTVAGQQVNFTVVSGKALTIPASVVSDSMGRAWTWARTGQQLDHAQGVGLKRPNPWGSGAAPRRHAATAPAGASRCLPG